MGIDINGVSQKIPICKLNNLWNKSNKKSIQLIKFHTLTKYDDLDLHGAIEHWHKVIISTSSLYLPSTQYELYLSSRLEDMGNSHSDRNPNKGATSIIYRDLSVKRPPHDLAPYPQLFGSFQFRKNSSRFTAHGRLIGTIFGKYEQKIFWQKSLKLETNCWW